jgi:glycosyltransferase involved in cell wall biosynthesis
VRIVYLHQYFNTPAMSGGTRSYEFARRFVEAGHEVHTITSVREGRADARGWRQEQIEGITVHWFPVPYSNRMDYGARIGAFMRFAVAAGRRAARIGGDVVFATSTPLTIALPGVFAARRLRVPMVFEVRDLWPELPIAVGALKNPALVASARWLERFAYRNAAHVVALSPGMAEGVVRAGYPADQVTIVPNSCDLTLFEPHEEAREEFLRSHPHLRGAPLVVYAGTLGPINGVGYLVDVARAMWKIAPEVRFLIAGDGKEAELVRRKASDAGVLDRNLWMIDPLPKEQVPGVLAAATVATSLFVDLPEMWANSANKFFDALASGTPLLINYQGWQAELLEESGAGIVVSPTDPERAAEALHGLIRDRQRLESASAAAARLARERFDRDTLAADLLSVLDGSVREDGSRRS